MREHGRHTRRPAQQSGPVLVGAVIAGLYFLPLVVLWRRERSATVDAVDASPAR